MIVRTYGRRSRGLTRSCSDVVAESPSQECPRDVYNFGFSSQGSVDDQWSDPYSLTLSQECRQLTILPPRKGGDCENVGVGLWKRKNVNLIGVDKKAYGSRSSQDSKDYEGLNSDYDFQKAKKVKKVNNDPNEHNSLEELEELSILRQRHGRDNGVFDFSENGDFWKSKTKSSDSDSYGLNSSQEWHELGILQRREYDANKDCWESDFVSRKSKKDRKEFGGLQKKKNNNKKKIKTKELAAGNIVQTATLMETQEYGEMMEHADEVNFALDGLKKGQQLNIRRASLLSLLSICGTSQQRRLLRVHGMAKTVIDATLGLSFDDPPSNLAAAALVYLLTSDCQDECLLDSPRCIRFLIKLLKPITSSAVKEKAPTVGSKLLGMCRNVGFMQDSSKGTDSSSTSITLKVKEILVNCKEMKPRDDNDTGMEEPKLNPKWISLLTMEKASSSIISLEDMSGTVRKIGSNFKERLREFGGLDAVFEVARNCHSIMEEWLEKSPSFAQEFKDNLGLESLLLLLKCLKVMENSTFLSRDNQCHFLGMKGKFDGQQSPCFFTKLILSVIKILSGVSLLRSSLTSSLDENMGSTPNWSSNSGDMESAASQKSLSKSGCNQHLISGQPGPFRSSLEFTQVSADPPNMRVKSSTAVSCSGKSENSNGIIPINSNASDLETDYKKKELIIANIEVGGSLDPFAFDEDDVEPSKWDLLSGRVVKPILQCNRATVSEDKDRNHSVLVLSQQESNNTGIHQSKVASCSASDEEKFNLLGDCLLTSVKVLMNLANDNPEGCQQIAKCGGLEILLSLIAGHFPSFSMSLPLFVDVSRLSSKSSPRIEQQSNIHLTDQDMDFLVAILGLLVNLVEKDEHNRSQLAAASVSLPSIAGLGSESQRDVISLLCSIFLANQGAGEAAGEGKYISWEDEDSILQGEKEAEKMIVEAYAALLIAFLSMESKSIRNAIGECLPNQSLAILVPVLERFVEFHLTLNMMPPETHKAVLEVIESCRTA